MLSISGGVLAVIVTAHLVNRKPRQTHEIAAQTPPQKVDVEVEVDVHLIPSHSLCHCWCQFCDASFEDLEHSKEIAELARRLQALYESNDESDSDSLVVNQRHMEFMRYLVQSGRLTEDL